MTLFGGGVSPLPSPTTPTTPTSISSVTSGEGDGEGGWVGGGWGDRKRELARRPAVRLTRSAESRKTTWKSRLSRSASTRRTIGRNLSIKLRLGGSGKVLNIPEGPQENGGEARVEVKGVPEEDPQVAQKAKLERVLAGRMTDLPPIASSVIRVFISSTFSDMTCERNALMENTYPKLKDFCKKYGLEFQPVDMRWGVREEVQDDHMTSFLCMKEIKACQRLSAGPSFVVMFGQKYGYRPFPSTIAAEEYENLYAVLVEKGHDVSLLDDWYKKDENMVPSMYTLVPISSHLPNFVNRRNEDLQNEDRDKWWEIFLKLQALLRTAADLCCKEGTLHTSERQKYYISVTEDEIVNGIMFDPNRHRQIYMLRRIIDLDQHLGHKKAAKFIDLVPSSNVIDQEAQAYLTKLRDEVIPKAMRKEYMSHFNVQWNDAGGINAYFHKEYLDSFCESFYSMMTKQVETCLALRDTLCDDSLYKEVLQHLSAASERCRTFRGRGALIARIKGYVMGESQQPMVIHGMSGSGKTSLMAVVASRVVGWYAGKASPVILLRFLGTSPGSSSVCPLLMTLCQQIARNYGVALEESQVDLQSITNLFLKMIKHSTEEKPLVIILDSLDQLSISKDGHRLGWLPWQLPPYTRMVISTLPEIHRILPRLQMSIHSRENFLEIPPLGEDLGLDLVRLWLQGERRTLTDSQLDLVKEALHSCSLPLYMKLVFEEVCRWRSWWSIAETQLQHTVHGIIHMLFERLEVHHGKVLVTHALAYLTAARSGLSEGELEDILSLDDTVLEEVFTFWVPPVRRLPPLLWTRIHEDLTHYLVEREADGITVLAWYHRQFREVVQQRYLKEKPVKIYIHAMLAEYFLGTWAEGNEKPFTFTDTLARRISAQCKNSKADRKVPAQPLKWKLKIDGKVKEVYNLRKMSELPYHLYHAEQYKVLWKEIYYNYQWLHTKLKAMSVMDLLSDLALDDKIDKIRTHGHKIHMIASAIRVAGSALKQLPNTLCVELLGRLKPYVQPGEMLEQLTEQCESEGLNHCKLLPSFPCFEAPKEALMHSLEGHRQGITDLIFSNDAENLFSISEDGRLNAWDVKTGDVLYSLDLQHTGTGRSSKILWCSRGYVILENYMNRTPIVLVDARTGEYRTVGFRQPGYIHTTFVTPNCVLREGHMYDVESGRELHKIHYLTTQKTFVTLAVTNNEEFIIIGEQNETVMIRISNEENLFTLPSEHMASVIVINRQDTCAVIGYSIDCLVKVVDIRVDDVGLGQVLFTFNHIKAFPLESFSGGEPYCQEVSELVMSPNNKMVLVNIKRVNLFIVPVDQGRVVMLDMDSICVNRPWVHKSFFTHDSNGVVAVVGNKLCLWNAQNGLLVARMSLVGRNEDKFQLVVNPCHDLVATVGKQENAIKLWKLQKLSESDGPSVHVYNNPVDVVTVDSRRKLAFVKTYRPLSSYKGYHYMDHFGIDVWDIATNTFHTYLPYGRYGNLCQMTMSHDGLFLLLLTSNQIASHIFMISVMEPRVVLHIVDRDVYRVELSPNNMHLLTESKSQNGKGSEPTILKLWSAETGTQLKVLHDAHHGTFTTCSQAMLCVTAKRKITALTLEEGRVESETIPTRSQGLTDFATVPNRPAIVMVSTSVRGYLTGKFKRVVLIDILERKIVCLIERVAPNGILDVSKDGRLGVDGYLTVHDLETGGTSLSGTKMEEKKLVCITYDGQYIIWADSNPTDCIKVKRIENGEVVAEAGTHSPVVSLNVVDFGYTVVVGCMDGHLLVFKLHNAPVLEDSQVSLDKVELSWAPLNADVIARLDPLYRVKSSDLRGSKLPETSTTVQNFLEETAKVSLSVQLSHKGQKNICSQFCTLL